MEERIRSIRKSITKEKRKNLNKIVKMNRKVVKMRMSLKNKIKVMMMEIKMSKWKSDIL